MLFTKNNASRMTSRRASAHAQAGLSILSALLALVIGSTVAIGTMQAQVTKNYIQDGEFEGDLFNRVKDAQNTYALENYGALQNDLPVTKNGVTLAFGAAIGQSLSPRVEDLAGMGYLNAGTTPASNKIENGTYRVVFRKTPVGCVTSACDIAGDAYIDQPYLRRGTVEPLGPSIGAFIQRVGGDATVSLVSAPALMISANQVTSANPVAGNPAGVIGARVGYGSSGFGRFLIVGDSRDPAFRGGTSITGVIPASGGLSLSVTGNTNLTGNLVATGSTTAGSFVTTGNSTAGSFTTVGTSTAGKVQISDVATVNTACTTNGLMAKDAAGQILSCQANVWSVQGDGRCVAIAPFPTLTNLNTLLADGRCYNGNSFTPVTSPTGGGNDWLFIEVYRHVFAGTYTVQKAYGMTGASKGMAWMRNQDNGVWGSWIPTAYPLATVGTPCPTEGQISQTASGSNLVCNGSIYRNVNDLFGKQGIFNIALYGNGDVVPSPVCGPSMIPTVVPLGVVSACIVGGGTCANNTGAFRGSIGGGNVVSITGSDGSLAGNARMTVGALCSTI